jgi:RNA polymerase sigma factor (sigma-70 family)
MGTRLDESERFAAWAERVRGGDRAAEEEVVLRFERPVRAYLQHHASDRTIVEEVGQETLMAIVCALRDGKVRQPELLPSFVCGIARNLLNDRLRSRARERTDPLPEGLDIPNPDPPEANRDRQQVARQAIESLAPEERGVLLMTLVEGLKPGEIAAKYGLTSEVIRQRKSRALKKLSELLSTSSRTATAARLKLVSRK